MLYFAYTVLSVFWFIGSVIYIYIYTHTFLPMKCLRHPPATIACLVGFRGRPSFALAACDNCIGPSLKSCPVYFVVAVMRPHSEMWWIPRNQMRNAICNFSQSYPFVGA